MREIKFRAWDKKLKEFNDILRMTLDGDRIEEDDYGNMPNMKDDIILMQYTGLKDKNGKEIYEGDIVESGDGTAKYKIVFEDGSFLAKSLDLKSFYADVSTYQKVIGNIFENKNLIN